MKRSLISLTLLLLALGAAQSLARAAAPNPFALAKDAFARDDFVEAARQCWIYLEQNKPGAEKYESAQFFLAQSLHKLGFYHGAVEYYFQVANTRQTPELLPRTIRALEEINRTHSIDEAMIIRDLIGDTDFGDLENDLSDFVFFWQGYTNLQRGLAAWASERFLKVNRIGYYFYKTLYVASVRLLDAAPDKDKEDAVTAFSNLFGDLELGSALDALRRKGEGDTKLAYALKALVNEESKINVRFEKLPKGWETELALLGLARISAETEVLLIRSRDTDEENFGMPLSYLVEIGGMPIYRRAFPFEQRGPAIRAVAARRAAVRELYGQTLHSLARLLYEQKQYAAAYDVLGRIPPHTELSSEVLLERAWSKYRAGNAHRAMGLLYALDAPVFGNLFAPEKYVLRGLIYRRFCHFRAAKVAARQFRTDFGAALRQIRSGKELIDIDRVREPALRRPQSRRLFLFLRDLKHERKNLSKYEDDDEWGGKKGLKLHLKSLYKQKITQIKAELLRSLRLSAAEVAEEMLRAEEQINLLEYEVGQAIFERVSEKAGAGTVRKRAPKVPISSKRTYYRFGGEYWTDELPHYKFNIDDRCVD